MARFSFLIWICLQVGVARGEGRVGLVNLRFVDVPDQERREWRDAIQRGVEARGLQVISEANLRYVESTSRELFDCFQEDRCRTEIGRRLQADLLLTGQISKEKDEWQANLSLHAVDLGTTAKNQVSHCPGCSAATFRDRLVETVNDLITADRVVPRATLLVRTRPPGAAIKVDGRSVGTAELEVIVVAGMHRLEATHENHDPLEISVEVKPQERLEVDVKLPPRTSHAPPVVMGPKTSWWTLRRIAGVAMIAAGGALFISGIPLAAIDGGCATDHCVFKYDTAAGGGALIGIGTALAITGGVVLLMSRATPVQAALGPGGMAVQF